MGWQPEHDELLRNCISEGQSFSQAAIAINEAFGTSYSRNACISRGGRVGLCSPKKRHPFSGVMSPVDRMKRQAQRRREMRWAKNPSLIQRYEQLAAKAKERKAMRDKFIERGTPKTSPVYRKHLPRQRDMTKAELRAQLTTAVENTAAMGALA